MSQRPHASTVVKSFPAHGTLTKWIAPDGWPLRTLVCVPDGPVRGTVVFLNGRADFLEKYIYAYDTFLSWGFAVASLDWRGQGLSGRLAEHPHSGHQDDFAILIEDLATWLSSLREQLPKPLNLVAHSMGGHIGLRCLREKPSLFDAGVLLAPMIGFRTGAIPQPVARRLASWMVQRGRSKELAFTQRPYGPLHRSPLRRALLTGNTDWFNEEHRWIEVNPDLALGGVTYGWLDAAFRSLDIIKAPGYLEAVDVPILMLMPEHEQVVDPVAARHAAQRLPRCRLVVIAEGRHELLRDVEPVRRKAFGAIQEALAGM